RQDRAAVRCDGEPDIGWARFDAALEPAAQMPRAIEIGWRVTKIVYKNQIVTWLAAQYGKQLRETGERVGGDLHQRDGARIACLCGDHRGAHQRRLAHAARAPQQHVMRRVTLREAGDVLS